jgi:threonine dehydrogenase-like Zn-dependent dehydrogenase
MKAVFARKPFDFQIREVDIPTPGDGEVLVKVHACGLCGTDMHFAVDWTQDYMPLGHEIAAEVVELGKGVTTCRVGDKVIVEDVGMCGVCEHCKNGEPYRCRNNYNLKGQPGMAEYMAVSEHLLNKFDGLDYVHASLTEPLAVALNTVLHADILLAGSLVVYGPGPIGLMCVRVARLQGAANVTLVGYSSQSPREVARMQVGAAFGADHLIYAADQDPAETVRSIFPNGADRVIVTSPPKTLPSAVKMCAFGGIVSFIGINLGGQSAVELDVNDLIFNKVTLRPTFAEPGIKFPVSIRLLKGGLVDARQLVSHTFTFAETERIFRMNADGNEKVIKAVLVP